MTTKTIKQEVDKTIYIAEDGTEFDNRYNCVEYEKKTILAPNLLFVRAYDMEGFLTDWFYIKSYSELDLVKQYYKDIHHCNLQVDKTVNSILMPDWFGFRICETINEDYLEMQQFREIEKDFWELAEKLTLVEEL